MKPRRRLATETDLGLSCLGPFDDTTIIQRHNEYNLLSDVQFRKKYRHLLFTPCKLEFLGKSIEIDMNRCTDTFCPNYGLPQMKFINIKSKASRYKQEYAIDKGTTISCSPSCTDSKLLKPLSHSSYTVSNWSIAEEIIRLTKLDHVAVVQKEYIFHNVACANSSLNPFDNSEDFYKKGVSKSNSPRFQCKTCGKTTNILPGQDQSFNYGQKRNDVLNHFIKLFFERMSVRGICSSLDIGASTFYHKVDWIYRKCLEFNNRYESNGFKKLSFKQIWINSDMMIYALNNIRKKGFGKQKKTFPKFDDKLMTYIVCSADMLSYYAFRCDIAYDSDVTLDLIDEETKLYHCDHSYNYLRKNERLAFSYCPQPPVPLDSQSESEYQIELIKFNERRKYVDGCHVSNQYTASAHFFLLSQMIKANEWLFVSDDDKSLQTAVFRIFRDKFKNDDAKYFTCQNDSSLSLADAGTAAFNRKNELKSWAKANGISGSLKEMAFEWIKQEIKVKPFYDSITVDGMKQPVRGRNKLEHPLPDLAEGVRYINLVSYSPSLNRDDLAELVLQVNSRAVNGVIHLIRRSMNLLERPLVTARGDGKSYIFANYNPKYAQQLLTIFRTVYNFCWVRKYGNEKMTPAQRLGLTDKVFDYKDIIYFR